jgi:hypothetical protein
MSRFIEEEIQGLLEIRPASGPSVDTARARRRRATARTTIPDGVNRVQKRCFDRLAVDSWIKPESNLPTAFHCFKNCRVDLAICRLPIVVAIPRGDFTIPRRAEPLGQVRALAHVFQVVTYEDGIHSRTTQGATDSKPAEWAARILVRPHASRQMMGVL